MTEPARVVLAIDPGRLKCGVAVVSAALEPDQSGRLAFDVLHQSVVMTAELAGVLAELAARFRPDAVIVGNGTGSAGIARAAGQLGTGPVVIVDEKFSTLLARKRFFEHNPPRGLRRLIPLSLQSPGRPYDDYVAVTLAELYLASAQADSSRRS